MSGDRRRSPRTEVDLRVEVQPAERELVLGLRAVDVNEHGLFVATTEPLALHTRVAVRIVVGQGETLTFDGRVVRILWPDRVAPGEPPGFGIQFEHGDAARDDRWRRFCDDVARHRTPAPERRRFLRVATRLELHVRAATDAALQAFVAHNLSASGAGFVTNAAMPLGLRLALALHHPTTDEIFRLEGEVVRCEAVEHGYLVGVRFDTPELQAFVRLTAALPG